METKIRKCGICGNSLPEGCHGNRKWCISCAERRQKQALYVVRQRRKAARIKGGVRPCAICGVAYTAKSHREKYCGSECAGKGLQLAIERQRERRLVAQVHKLRADKNEHAE